MPLPLLCKEDIGTLVDGDGLMTTTGWLLCLAQLPICACGAAALALRLMGAAVGDPPRLILKY